MVDRCSAQQVAEAVLIWSAHNGSNPILCLECEDAEKLKCLDLFLSSVVVFGDAFFSEMTQSFIKFQDQLSLPKKSFIEYLKLRSLLLTEKNGYFDLILTCSYISRAIMTRAYSCHCFHFARVACKLLTTILEDRFGEIFETDSGWKRLVLYCRNVHAVVFPSQKNRPPGYDPHPRMDSDNSDVHSETDDTENRKKTETDEFKVEQNDCGIKGFSDELLNSLPVTESSHLCGFKASSAIRSIVDDTIYCRYFAMDSNTLCRRITDSPKHLDDVYNLLNSLDQDRDAKCITPAKYDISISDDEYVAELERDGPRFYSEQELVISYEVKDCFAKEICEKENSRFRDKSNQHLLNPRDITREEVIQHISNMCAEEDDKPRCKLCYGKMYTFINNWKKSFIEKYSNSDIVTDVF